MGRRTNASDVFLAIADPTRRTLLDLVSDRERSVKELAAPFRISQPALSQHLKVLRDVGLVQQRKTGRERFYRLDPRPLVDVAAWIVRYEKFWRERLTKLGQVLEELP